jgi:hypothetical protein
VGFVLCFVLSSEFPVPTGHRPLQRLAYVLILVVGHRSVMISQALLMAFDSLRVRLERFAVLMHHL